MPFREVSRMDARLEFVTLAMQPGVHVRELCRRFGISPDTAYRLLRRYRQQGVAGLADRSRCPRSSPRRTPKAMVEQVVALRDKYPSWGGRKIHHVLARRGEPGVPAASTITDILRRDLRIMPESSPTPFVRFERTSANDLWQMDFKGPLAGDRGDCHPLTVLDDYSRFNVLLEACPDQKGPRVKAHLSAAFRRYGLPRQILSDNGPPWGSRRETVGGLTALGAWMIRLGIDPIHGRPYHPQTQGKEERFHRTLKAAVVPGRRYANIEAYTPAFAEFRDSYNLERPHEALAMAVPASRCQPSIRRFPETLPNVEYGVEDLVRRVQVKGDLEFKGCRHFLTQALASEHVALRPTTIDGMWDLFFCTRKIALLNERDNTLT
jgi:transposase InsO family protein